MRVHNNKVLISQSNMNRMFYGTHQPWQVLRNEGAILLQGPMNERLGGTRQPNETISGFDLMKEELRFLGPLTLKGAKFTTNVPTTGEEFRVKECRLPGHPAIVLAVDSQKGGPF